MDNFLFELGLAEVPAKQLPKVATKLYDNVVQEFMAAGITFSKLKLYYTPRRITLIATDLLLTLPAKTIEKKGPAVAVSFDNANNPTKAALGFAKSVQADINDLEQRDGYLYYNSMQQPTEVLTILPTILTNSVKQIVGVKGMRWGEFTDEFIRPIRWLMCLLKDQVVPVKLFGEVASNVTYGHRVLGNDPIQLPTIEKYLELLADKQVIVDQEHRQQLIIDGIKKIEQTKQVQCEYSTELLTEVVNLVEYPIVYYGTYDLEFLKLPPEVLVTTITTHQKCFPLMAAEQAHAGFIMVSNLDSTNPQQLIAGNENVVRARLSDAKFFYEVDRAVVLDEYLAKLTNISMHQKLGSVASQGIRIGKLIAMLDDEIEYAKLTGELAKFDLSTNMVGEFPELQGVMGSYYAKHYSVPNEVAVAIGEQYLGVQQLPQTLLGALLAVSFRLDHLCGYFGVGMLPKGDQDPYGLRRCALIIIKVILAHKINCSLSTAVKFALSNYEVKVIDQSELIVQYILERFKIHNLEQGINHQVLTAVLASNEDNLLLLQRKIMAVTEFLTTEHATNLLIANKRISKLLANIKQKTSLVKLELLQEPAEKELYQQLQQQQAEYTRLLANGDYVAALVAISKLANAIDNFFANIMVNCDDQQLQQNRVNLLASISGLLSPIADLSLITITE